MLGGISDMAEAIQIRYDLIWNHENQFAYKVAKQVIQKPPISVWLVLMPILFLFYAHKIQQYKAGIHNFSKGLMQTKTLALDSALEEINIGMKNKEVKNIFFSSGSETSIEVIRVRNSQLAEFELLKVHYGKLLRQEGTSYQILVRKAYRTSGAYRLFLNQLTQIEKEVMEAVLQAYHPKEEDMAVSQKMQEAMHALREEDLKAFFA
jgi:hypothetical protein